MPAVLLASFAVHAFVTDATDRRDAVSGAENPIGARLSSVKQLDYGRVAVHEPGNHPPTVATPAPVFTATTGSTGWSFLGPPPDGAGPPPVPTEPPTLPVDPAPEPLPDARVPAAPPVPEATPAPAPPPPAPPPAVAPEPAPPPPPPPEPGRFRQDYAAALLDLLNGQRAAHGLGAVAADGSLTAAAEGYARLHATQPDPYALSHWLDGGPGDRAWRAGYCCAVGEILVVAEASPEYMVNLWMNSPPHRAIITDGKYSQVGIGCYEVAHTEPSGYVSHPILCVGDFGALSW